MRPWGERSFYAEDPWGNPPCFVEERTVYTGSVPPHLLVPTTFSRHF